MHETMALHTAARRYCMERAPGLDPAREEQCIEIGDGHAIGNSRLR